MCMSIVLLLAGCGPATEEPHPTPEDTTAVTETSVTTESTGEPEADAPAETAVYYSAFGAKGDGKHDDLAAIAAAHAYANERGLPVRAEEGAVYYIASIQTTVKIQTDTDWTGASFIIDDTGVGTKGSHRAHHVFEIAPSAAPYDVKGITSARRGQTKFDVQLPADSLVILTDTGSKQYIREGKNANDGSDKSDVMILHADGTVEAGSELVWDFDNVTSAVAVPLEREVLTVRGGKFTTIANVQDSSSYYNRGIHITRSGVVLDGIAHYVTGEGEKSAPYYGFLNLDECANVTVKNCILTARRKYSPGTYDIKMVRALNVTFENCIQSNDILDTAYWGIMLCHRTKNLTVRGCSFSRVDAHSGFFNVSILDSTLGHQCLNAIGGGLLRIENSTLYGKAFIKLRSDYGSVWNGDVLIRNCTWIPDKGKTLSGRYALIDGSYSGFHDFGYECGMPRNIVIEGLFVDDSRAGAAYAGIDLLGNIIPQYTSENYEIKVREMGYPYRVTEQVSISGYTSASGKEWRLSPNSYMYRQTNVTTQDIKSNTGD